MKTLHDFLSFLFPVLCLGVVADGGAGGAAGGTALDTAGGGGGAGAGGGQGGGTGLPSADFRTYLKEDGTIANPDGFFGKDAAHLAKRFTSPHALAKSYVSLERQLSNSKKVAVPNENSTAEEWDAFFAASGRPAKPEEYEIKAPETLPEGVWSDEEAKEFATMAHKLGLSKKAANALVSWQAERLGKAFTSQQEQAETARNNAIADLKKEWGAAYDEQLKLAKAAAVTFGGEDMLKHPLANDPAFIKAMAKAGAAISEGKLAGGRQTGLQVDTPEAIRQKIGEIQGNRQHPYWLANHPNHMAAVEEMQRLYAKLHPEPKA